MAIISALNDSDSEDDVLVLKMLSNVLKPPRRKRNCITTFMQTISMYRPDEFRSHFRMYRETFHGIVELLAPKIVNVEQFGPGRPHINVEKQVLVFLWFMANQEVFRSIADRFDLSKSTCWDSVHKIASILCQISKDHIVWPTKRQLNETIQGFQLRGNFPGVVGAIDGCHFRISTPVFEHTSYINRNKYHSLHLQGVCNSKYLFIDCFVGYPGSVHDARVTPQFCKWFNVKPVFLKQCIY
ncbi:hypothetical protein Zmor_014941 [Zophobas morio]|uniref:Nuclease HARBI1 n=1 Tax=Zophobas morio TaxID=2755281 RepID=A0AA38IIE1_9CUCU|nr:hypothetical protein Zmor_014941 [Zophobas morio]